MRMAAPSRGLAAFSEIAPAKCVSRTPAVSVSQEKRLALILQEQRFQVPGGDPVLRQRESGAVVGDQTRRTHRHAGRSRRRPRLALWRAVTAVSAICAPAYCESRCCVVLTGVSLGSPS